MARRRPNVLITGTPGTGKTTLCEAVAGATGLEHVNVGDVVKREGCHEGVDEEFDSLILDEEKLLAVLEPRLEEGNVLLDFHTCDIFEADQLDLVLVLTSETEQLFDRLKARYQSTPPRLQESARA